MKKWLDYIFSNFLLYIILYSIMLDVFRSYLPAGSGIGKIQDYSILMFSLYFVFSKTEILTQNIWITVFILYTLALSFFSSDPTVTYPLYIQVLNVHLLLPISFLVIREKSTFDKLHRILAIGLIVFVINSVICMTMGFGDNEYGGRFRLGAFILAKLYVISFIIFLLPVILPTLKNRLQQLVILGASGISFVLLLLSMRRTAVLLVAIGYFIYFFFSDKKKELLKVLGIGLLLIGLAFPLYKDMLIDGLVSREEIFQSGYSLEEEGRYMETIMVFDESLGNEVSWSKTLFGKDLWLVYGTYGDGIFGTRPLHVDYNKLLHTTGIIGLLLYLLIFVKVLLDYFHFSKYVPFREDNFLNELRGYFIIFFIINLFLLSTGHIWLFAFRCVIMIYLGGILGIFHEYYIKEQNKKITRKKILQ